MRRSPWIVITVIGLLMWTVMSLPRRASAFPNRFGNTTPEGLYSPHADRGFFHVPDPASLPARDVSYVPTPANGRTLQFRDADLAPDGTLYGTRRYANDLYMVDPLSGQYQAVGEYPDAMTCHLLAIDSQGRAVGFGSNGFYQVDLNDASLTVLGPATTSARGIGFDGSDRLFGVCPSTARQFVLEEYNPNTGVAIDSWVIVGLQYRYDNAVAIAFDRDNDMYVTGVNYNVGDSPVLYEIDLNSRSAIRVGFLGAKYDSRYSWSLGYHVPEPATLALLALGGLALIRRRAKP